MIDLASGELGQTRTFEIPDAMHRREFERHPVTGTHITGHRLSCWNEIVELTVRAHQEFGAFHSIGWDVAITDKGLVLIEGNHDWGTMIAQYPGPAPLGWTRLPEDVRQCFDAPAARGIRALASTSSHSVR